MDRSPSSYLRVLRRRAEHLSQRINANPGYDYDRAEREALRWAIERIEASATDREKHDE